MPNTSLISIVVLQGIEMYSILPQQKEHYNEVTVDWQHTIIYLLWVDVSGCCVVGSMVRVSQAGQKGFFFFCVCIPFLRKHKKYMSVR